MTASFTAHLTFADDFSGSQTTVSHTGSIESATRWLNVQYFQAGDNVVDAGITEVKPVEVEESRRERVLRVMAEVTAEEDAAELNRIRESVGNGVYVKTWRGGPVPVV